MKNNWISKLEPVISYSRNRLGMRGEERPEDFKNVLSVITVGGSTTECKFLSDSLTWPEQFKKAARKEIPNLWVNNAGLDGTSTYAHIQLLEDYLIKLKPNYIFFLVGVNDVELDQPSDFDFLATTKTNTSSLKTFTKSIINKSEVLGLLFNLYRYHLAYKKGLVHRNIDFNKLKEIENSPAFIAKRLKFQSPYLTKYRRRIIILDSISRHNSIYPVFITQPSLAGSFRDPGTGRDFSKLAVGIENENSQTAWLILESYNNILRDLERKRNLEVIDLAGEMPKNSAYYYDFSHYTAAGAQTLGKIIAAHFSEIVSRNKNSNPKKSLNL